MKHQLSRAPVHAMPRNQFLVKSVCRDYRVKTHVQHIPQQAVQKPSVGVIALILEGSQNRQAGSS